MLLFAVMENTLSFELCTQIECTNVMMLLQNTYVSHMIEGVFFFQAESELTQGLADWTEFETSLETCNQRLIKSEAELKSLQLVDSLKDKQANLNKAKVKPVAHYSLVSVTMALLQNMRDKLL